MRIAEAVNNIPGSIALKMDSDSIFFMLLFLISDDKLVGVIPNFLIKFAGNFSITSLNYCNKILLFLFYGFAKFCHKCSFVNFDPICRFHNSWNFCRCRFILARNRPFCRFAYKVLLQIFQRTRFLNTISDIFGTAISNGFTSNSANKSQFIHVKRKKALVTSAQID